MSADNVTLRGRALATGGMSSETLYQRAREILARRGARGHVIDVGCGRGALLDVLAGIAVSYTGVDAIRHDGFPSGAAFRAADLDRDPLPVEDASADVVTAVEVIEHLENPRRFIRELVRVTRPGGTILVSTPNQVSALSLLTLVSRRQFNAFQNGGYPAHLTALLPIDLERMALECQLVDIEIEFSCSGRIPLTARRYPRSLSRFFPRLLSDNVFATARVPASSR